MAMLSFDSEEPASEKGIKFFVPHEHIHKIRFRSENADGNSIRRIGYPDTARFALESQSLFSCFRSTMRRIIGSIQVYSAPNHGDNFLQLRGRQSTRQSIKEPILWQYLNEVRFEKR
jgi:hypothetical protein